MIEDILIEKYAKFGRVSPSREIYLPINLREKFVNDCTELNVAIIGIELFHMQECYVIPVNPISGIDSSELLRKYERWEDIVKECNRLALYVLNEEEKEDNTLYFNPCIFEENKWK
ncbi:MAG TPA: hypothetical protein DEG71_04415 [Clostridiales bacterium]|nr:hypothetical protein [Clostridiales bacterium]